VPISQAREKIGGSTRLKVFKTREAPPKGYEGMYVEVSGTVMIEDKTCDAIFCCKTEADCEGKAKRWSDILKIDGGRFCKNSQLLTGTRTCGLTKTTYNNVPLCGIKEKGKKAFSGKYLINLNHLNI